LLHRKKDLKIINEGRKVGLLINLRTFGREIFFFGAGGVCGKIFSTVSIKYHPSTLRVMMKSPILSVKSKKGLSLAILSSFILSIVKPRKKKKSSTLNFDIEAEDILDDLNHGRD